jgi:hypothetical protein
LGSFRVITQGMTKLSERRFDTVLVLDNRPLGPQLLSYFLLGNQFARAFQKQKKNLNWLPFQPYSCAHSAQLSRSTIEFERSKPNRV